MKIKPIELLIKVRDEASSALGSVQAKVTAVAAAVAGFFTATLFSKSISSAKDLEAALSRVAAAADGGEAELVQLRAAAEKASGAFTSVEAAGALENLVKAGLSAKDAIGALPAVLSLAQAGDIELAQSAEIVTKTMMGMGLAVEDTGRIADVLAKGANASNTSVTGLAQALSYAAPMAKSLKLPLETTVALIGKLADAGIDASRAGTALNSIFSQFSDPASNFRRELSAIGITTNNFEKALHQLAAAGKSGSKAILAVGQEAGPALQSLLNQGMGALDGLKKSLLEAEGSAKATAETMNNNLAGAARAFWGVWDALLVKLGTPVLTTLKDGVVALTGRIRAFIDGGTAAKFGEAIAAGFKAGLDWAQRFFDRVDFDALAAKMKTFADEAGQTFQSISQKASQAGSIVELVWNAMAGGVNAVMSAIYSVAEAFTGVAANMQSSLAVILDGLSKVTFGDVSKSFAEAAQSVRESAEATWAVSETFAEKARQSFIQMGDHAQGTRDAWAALNADVSAGADAQRSAAGAISGTTGALNDQAGAAARTGEAAAKAGAQQRQAAEEARAAIEEMRKKYRELIASGDLQGAAELLIKIEKASKDAALGAVAMGDATAKAGAQQKKAADEAHAAIEEMRKKYRELIDSGDLQGAAELLVKIEKASKDAAKGVGEIGSEAEDAAARTKAAFEAAGIKTKEELKSLADRARAEFEIIKNSGQATAEGVATAWQRAADAAIRAANGVAPGWVQAEAAANGYVVQVDRAGKATLQSAEAAQRGTADLARGWHETGQAAAYAGDQALMALDRQITAQEQLNKLKEREIQLYEKKWKMDKEQYALNSAGQRVQGLQDTSASIYNKAKSAGLDEETALRLSSELMRDRGQGWTGNPELIDRAIQDEVMKQAQRKVNEERSSTSSSSADRPAADTPQRGASASSGGGASYVSNITIDGVTKPPIRYADAESQTNGENLLRQIAQARGASVR